ncbi:non-hydrolyzing UDP-N-acetylglucosamine 2-epimerase [Vagococcus fessus]|uniref:UDP-N-acetylglucosamine 2-epimerase (non-hydrolyzing) n=1 Tax=Vagococcus fessus TaxID=120370 RepID=A0A430A5J0_9ENTE|nr:UDP-N-acetylglucosamine 2-epimerase (non-hydrolyzing) [Vagococcus fessus]RSU02046.1 UDP-N-acetylglucosamine 2-epimerase (non-hydrolyzing) [Vagococcus fessus]
MKKLKVVTLFGTRPEAIKMAPLVKELESREEIASVVISTGQHKEMLQQVLDIFEISPDYDLEIMSKKQTLAGITTAILTKLTPILEQEGPDVILVHGDTTTALVGGLTAFYNQIPIGHVEAGLRTYDKYSPFPEEMNRQLIDRLADYYYAPTPENKESLLKENVSEKAIIVTGNTAIDAMSYTVGKTDISDIVQKNNEESKLMVLTMHRRENLGEPMKQTLKAIRQVLDNHPDYELVFPVHLNPVVQDMAKSVLGDHDRVHLINPLDVVEFHNLIAHAELILSDSGGVQEEAPHLNKPVLVLRESTERTEAVTSGTVKLIGTTYDGVLTEIEELLSHPESYEKMADAQNPYGDGQASRRIVDHLIDSLGE